MFDLAGNLLEVLTIQYTENGPKYYLDNVPKDSPNFTKYEPEGVYRVYELDGLGNPITEDNIVSMNGLRYRVTYSSDQVMANDTVIIINHTSPLELPDTGGIGMTGYYLFGGILILIFLLYCLFLRRYSFMR